MTSLRPFRALDLRSWLIWTAGFLAFPLAGLAGTAGVGRLRGAAGAASS